MADAESFMFIVGHHAACTVALVEKIVDGMGSWKERPVGPRLSTTNDVHLEARQKMGEVG